MTHSPYTLAEGNKRPSGCHVFLLLSIVFLGFQYKQQAWPFCDCFSQIRDDEEYQDQLPQPNDTPDLQGSYLVVVEESEARDVARMRILNDYQFWFGLRDRGLKGFRILDPDSSDSKSFIREAANASIEPPFIMHVSNDGKVLTTIPFPNEISKIEGMLQ